MITCPRTKYHTWYRIRVDDGIEQIRIPAFFCPWRIVEQFRHSEWFLRLEKDDEALSDIGIVKAPSIVHVGRDGEYRYVCSWQDSVGQRRKLPEIRRELISWLLNVHHGERSAS